jgi:hypothetical protein
MIIDQDIHLLPSWASHIPSDGSGIDNGKPNPTNLLPNGTLEPGVLSSVLSTRYLQIEGPALATGEFYIQRPIVPGLQPQLRLRFIPDADDGTTSALTEHDIMLWSNGLLANLSCQVYGPTGKIMVGAGAGGWADTGLFLGSQYTPDVQHEVEIDYAIDWTNNLFSVSTLTVDGKPNVIPSQSQKQKMVATTWPGSGLFLQIQKQLARAGRAGIFLNGADIQWQ